MSLPRFPPELPLLLVACVATSLLGACVEPVPEVDTHGEISAPAGRVRDGGTVRGDDDEGVLERPDAGRTSPDAGGRPPDGGSVPDGGAPDGGSSPDGGSGPSDGGTDDMSPDAGVVLPDVVQAIRFGGTAGSDGLFSTQPVDPNLRTVAGWFRFRVTTVGIGRQQCAWSLENPAPSNAYQLLLSRFGEDTWEAHDQAQGGFLFAPVDLGWWFIAESHRLGGGTTLYWKKEGDLQLSSATGNRHPALTGVTRFLVGTDDATGQNEWFDGDIAGIKVWSEELSAAELELESAQLRPVRTADLHAFYPLQSLSTLGLDASGNGRHLSPIRPGQGSWSVLTGPAISP